MSLVRVHNFSVSLDGFGTGEGLTFDAPFGHAGHRMHQPVVPTVRPAVRCAQRSVQSRDCRCSPENPVQEAS